MKYLKRLFESSESGVMFILVLMLVAAVGLLVIPIMLVSTTGLRGTNRSEQRFTERYAVDAGVEHALWNIKYGGTFLDGDPNTMNYTETFNGLPTMCQTVEHRLRDPARCWCRLRCRGCPRPWW